MKFSFKNFTSYYYNKFFKKTKEQTAQNKQLNFDTLNFEHIRHIYDKEHLELLDENFEVLSSAIDKDAFMFEYAPENNPVNSIKIPLKLNSTRVSLQIRSVQSCYDVIKSNMITNFGKIKKFLYPKEYESAKEVITYFENTYSEVIEFNPKEYKEQEKEDDKCTCYKAKNVFVQGGLYDHNIEDTNSNLEEIK